MTYNSGRVWDWKKGWLLVSFRVRNSLSKSVNTFVLFTYLLSLFPSLGYADESKYHASSDARPLHRALNLNDMTDNEVYNKLLEPEEKEIFSKMVKEPIEIATGLWELAHKLQSKEIAVSRKIGHQTLQEQTSGAKEKDLISTSIKGLGRAEVKVIGKGERTASFVRIVHEKTGGAYEIIDLDQVRLDLIEDIDAMNPENYASQEEYEEELRTRKHLSFHLRAHVAQQLVDSGTYKKSNHVDKALVAERLKAVLEEDAESLQSKAWWQKLLRIPGAMNARSLEGDPVGGRDTTLIFHKSGKHVKTEVNMAPRSKWSRDYWKNYWLRIWEPPQYNEEYWRNGGFAGKIKTAFTGDYLLGWFFASAQMLVTLGIGRLEAALNATEYDPSKYYSMAVTSLAFGLVLGVFTKTFQNWNYIGSEFSRNAKSWVVSISYGLAYFLLWGASSESEQLNSNAEYLFAAFILLSNIVIKGWAKVWSMEYPRFRKKVGESSGNFYIKNEYTIPFVSKNGEKVTFKIADEPIDTQIENSGIDIQKYQLIGTLPKVAHLANLEANIMGTQVPVGFIAYPLIIPPFHLWTIHQASKYTRANSNIPEEKAVFEFLLEKESSMKEKGQALKDYEALTLRYYQLWEDSKLLHIPYLKSILGGFYKYGLELPASAMKEIMKILAPSIFAMGLFAHAQEVSDVGSPFQEAIEVRELIPSSSANRNRNQGFQCNQILLVK